jgi:glycosyltransferase involved in cell wall biosynthesis
MKISIITVVWNNKKTIKEAIKSVLNQTYENIEYIVVDGASTDGTIDIVRSYGDKISQFISEKDDGLYDAMNKGIGLATGDIIGILNSDDVYFDMNVIQNVIDVFEEKKVDSVYGDLYYVDEHDLSKVSRYWKSSVFVQGSFSKGWHPPHPTFFVKKEIYNKYGIFDDNNKISADFELMLRFLERFKISTTYLPQVIVKMREGGASNQSIKNILKGNLNIIKAFDKNDIKVNKFTYLFYRFIPKISQKLRRGR